MWVAETLGASEERSLSRADDGFQLARFAGSGLELFVVTASGSSTSGVETFVDTVASVYRHLFGALEHEGLHPWRFWNYIPDIHRAAPGFGRRYEAFNAGRYAAFQEIYGERRPWPLVAASAVGHRRADLMVCVLAADAPGKPIENPRQFPAYHYSRQHGPFPPCFARAVRLPRPLPNLGASSSAIVSGTSSIIGETSHHLDDVEAQTSETLANLAALASRLAGGGASVERRDASQLAEARGLDLYRHVRAYVVHPEDAQDVLERLSDALPGVQSMDVVRADLCRPELLVEVEGLLALDPTR